VTVKKSKRRSRKGKGLSRIGRGIATLPMSKPRSNRGRKPHADYPYDKWFTDNPVTLTQGIDFHCTLRKLNRAIRHEAYRRGLKVSILLGTSAAVVMVRGPYKPRSEPEIREVECALFPTDPCGI
jgi:hypothetical protein